MNALDCSLEDIIAVHKLAAKPASRTTKPGKVVKPGSGQSRPILKPRHQNQKPLFTETYKALSAPVKEIYTSRYMPPIGSIKLVAINTNAIAARVAATSRTRRHDPTPSSAQGTSSSTRRRVGDYYRPSTAARHSPTERRLTSSVKKEPVRVQSDLPPVSHPQARRGINSIRAADKSNSNSNSSSNISSSNNNTMNSSSSSSSSSVRNGQQRAHSVDRVIKVEPLDNDTEMGPVAMDEDDKGISIKGIAPPPGTDNFPATIEIENLDSETTAEDVKMVCSRFGEILSCICTNGFSQVTFARRAAGLAAVQTLNGKRADHNQVLRVSLRTMPIIHSTPVAQATHVPSPIAGPMKMLTKSVEGSLKDVTSLYQEQLANQYNMLRMQRERMAQLQQEEHRLARLRLQGREHLTDLKEGGVFKNWSERELVLALQALKILGRATEGCDSIFTEEGIRTLMYHSGLCKVTEATVDRTSSRETLKCLANALLLKPTTRPIFERLEGHGQCALLLKRPHLSNESQFLFSRILFLVTIDATSIVKSLMDDYHGVDTVGVVLKTQLARSPDGTMFSQSMVLSEALKYLFNLMIVDTKIERSEEAHFTREERTLATAKRFQSLLPTIVSILTTIPPSSPDPLQPPHSHAIHVLLNFPISTSALLVTRSQQAILLDVLTQILNDTLKHSLNTDDEASTDGLSNGTELDEIVPPLVIVLTNIASAGGEGRAALKAKLLPDDVNLGVPASVSGAHVEEIDDDDSPAASTATTPTTATSPSPSLSKPTTPPAATTATMTSSTASLSSTLAGSEATSSARRAAPRAAVNPITGAYYPDPSAIRTAMADMTEEEKEEEAGRLLDMIDKMRRTGVMEMRNPALEAGLRQRERERHYEEQERREQEEEEALEREYGHV
ncbi:hypothetical protein BGZ98_000377 [Dissophora globulifera]|nr:hypothetical protein BGZ98_000377 [Dissophora globulifera]